MENADLNVRYVGFWPTLQSTRMCESILMSETRDFDLSKFSIETVIKRDVGLSYSTKIVLVGPDIKFNSSSNSKSMAQSVQLATAEVLDEVQKYSSTIN